MCARGCLAIKRAAERMCGVRAECQKTKLRLQLFFTYPFNLNVSSNIFDVVSLLAFQFFRMML